MFRKILIGLALVSASLFSIYSVWADLIGGQNAAGGGSGTVTSVTASGDASSSGGNSPNITINTNLTQAYTTVSSFTINGGVQVSSGLIVSTPSFVLTSTFTLTSSMTVVLASAPAGGAWITLTLPRASSNPGLDIMIYKLNTSTTAILIQGAVSDTVEGTGTIRLDAPFQHASLHSLGAAGWGSGLGGVQYTPQRLTAVPLGGQHVATGVGASSDIITCPIYVPSPVLVTGYAWRTSVQGGGNISFAIMDSQGNVVTSTGPVSVGAAGAQTISQPAALVPPGDYVIAYQPNNTTTNIEGQDSTGGNVLGCGRTVEAAGGIVNISINAATSITTVGKVDVLLAGKRQTAQ